MPKAYKTMEQYVQSILRNDILEGKYKPGDKLRQDEVAKEFEVSTTPVREAFRGLRSEGLVTIDANKGVVVKGLTLADVAEIYEIRIMLEPLLAQKSVDLLSDDALNKAKSIHATMLHTKNPHEWSALNKEFHLVLMNNQSHTRLYEMVKSLFILAVPYVSLSLFIQPSDIERDNRDHAAILNAYEQKNAIKVNELLSQHLHDTLEIILRNGVELFAEAHE